MITDAVIPVGGLGTRMLPATRSLPKEMLPLVDKPAVQYVVEELRDAGSGGAIAAVCRDESHRAEVTAALREIGCATAPTGASGGAAKPGA